MREFIDGIITPIKPTFTYGQIYHKIHNINGNFLKYILHHLRLPMENKTKVGAKIGKNENAVD